MSAVTLGMNESRDLYLDRFGNLVVKTDEDAMADYLTQRLSSLVGEFRFDKQRGLPYMDTVFSGGTEGIAPLRATMISALLSSEHVVSVAYLDIVVSGSVLMFESGVATEFGNIVLRSQA